jgi:ferredoxin-NADP reductase
VTGAAQLSARLAAATNLSPSLRHLVLVPADGGLFPVASPGAHLLLTLNGPDRHWRNAYSLVSPSDQRTHYELIVRRVDQTRGGSAFVHDHLAVGDIVTSSLPTNLFPIVQAAGRHLLISAGIGLTPFLSFLPALKHSSSRFELHHVCKPTDEAAFTALLAPHGNAAIQLHTARHTLALPALLAQQTLGTHLYVCGPSSFMDHVLDCARGIGWPDSKLHQEHFGAATGGAPFRVRLARSARVIEVAGDESLLEALESAGIDAPCLCRGGACRECAVTVLGGVPDHRDHVLNAEERASGTVILTCVSRARSPELALDL